MPDPSPSAPRPLGNRYDLPEWAGALGDLGTLLPFVMVYLGVLKLDPAGVLVGFGLSMLVCGLWFKTPIPVQPMKAAGAVAAAQAGVLTAGAVYGAGLVTGLLWLLLGATGAARSLGHWVGPPVVRGLMLGLGAAFMLQAVNLMALQWWLGAAGLGLLLGWPRLPAWHRLPAIVLVLLLGLGHALATDATAWLALAAVRPAWHWPPLGWPMISAQELLTGAVLLALPQAPLTLGNAIIGIRSENNRLFPQRPVTERGMALSTGLMNVLGSAVGAVPMCHGAGGMSGHVAFGARTGGSVVILGGLLLVLGLAFGDSVLSLFGLLPPAVLGSILFVTGAQLAGGQLRGGSLVPRAWTVLLLTAAVSTLNVAAGLITGVLLQALWLRAPPARA